MLEINKHTVWYESLQGDIKALDHCSLTVQGGSITCVLGTNGAGKTTLFRSISGILDEFDAVTAGGSISFQGACVDRLDSRRRIQAGLSQAPQGRHIFYTMSVDDNLEMGAFSRRKPKNTIERERQNVYDLFPVLGRRKRQKAGTLSGGEQQMLSIGRALMAAPRLLMLDEPFLGLAPVVIEQLTGAMRHLQEKGMTILFAEQRARAALSVADTAWVMKDGFMIADGPAVDIKKTGYVRRLFFGEKT
jgi:branched-chain amino acid transport system ATP-binding protein